MDINSKQFVKYYSAILVVLLLLLVPRIIPADAQTPTIPKTKIGTSPTVSVSLSPTAIVEKDVKELKDKIATKVAELRQSSKTIISGMITANDSSSLTIQSEDGASHKVTYDETITKLISLKKKTPEDIKIDVVTKGDYAVVSGLQIEDMMTASTLYIDQKYLVLSGKVSDVNKPNFEITVVTTDKDTYTLDIESATRQSIINPKLDQIEKSGFSKINVGDTIHFVIIKPKDAHTLKATAKRLLIIPQEYFVKK